MNQTKYAIPSNSTKELLSIDKSKLINQKKVEIREVFYEIIFARDFLYNNSICIEDYYKDLECILIEINNIQYIFVIDSIIDLQNIVIKALPNGLDHLNYCSGTTILPEGNAALILSMEKIFKVHKNSFLAPEICTVNLNEAAIEVDINF